MAESLAPLQPNLNPITPKVKSVVAQPVTDPMKIRWQCPLCRKIMPQFVRDCHVKLHAIFCCPRCSNDYPLHDLGSHLIECMVIYTFDQFPCSICGSPDGSTRHVKIKHISKLTCSIPGCEKSFTFDTFAGHIKNCIKIYNKRSQSNPFIANPNSQRKKAVDNPVKTVIQFKCIFCTTVCSTDGILQKHIEKVHIKHACPLCHARDISETNFDDHVIKCLKKRPNQDTCPLCGTSLANKNNNHIHSFHATLKISCPSCKQKFKCDSIARHAVSCQKKVSQELSTATASVHKVEIAIHPKQMPVQSHAMETLNITTSKPVSKVSNTISLSDSEFPALALKPPINQGPVSKRKLPANKPTISTNDKQLSTNPLISISPDSNSDCELTSLFDDDDYL
ncbi:hypothetical protein LOD99_13228 [Oopsacas minuta]|uniref:C2H2-type domain-containing protein n=1 Tax=Oopsacas minuta TaxID=111878 RepID=A0AAV7JB70_9METZ|nr:hypothetical protein LOD99_13228 [Oopsacas minuta]